MQLLFALAGATLAGAAGAAAPLDPWWRWSWDTVPVWASGQGSSDFSPDDVALLSRFPVIWTQGQQMPQTCDRLGPACRWSNCSGDITRDWVRCSDPRRGYGNTENCTASDAAKIHARNASTPVMGYLGFYGCCSGYYSWWWRDFNSSRNSRLWLRGDDGEVCFSDTDRSRGPIYDLCSDDMLAYYEGVILASIVEEGSGVAGVFFDEVDHFVMPTALGGRDFYHCRMSTERKAVVKQCFVDAMVRLTQYVVHSLSRSVSMSLPSLALSFCARQASLCTERRSKERGVAFGPCLRCFGPPLWQIPRRPWQVRHHEHQGFEPAISGLLRGAGAPCGANRDLQSA